MKVGFIGLGNMGGPMARNLATAGHEVSGFDVAAPDVEGVTPVLSAAEAARDADVVITMGCGDTCPFYPGKRYEDWVLDDPAGQGVEAVRPIRDTIRARVETLIADLLPTARP